MLARLVEASTPGDPMGIGILEPLASANPRECGQSPRARASGLGSNSPMPLKIVGRDMLVSCATTDRQAAPRAVT